MTSSQGLAARWAAWVIALAVAVPLHAQTATYPDDEYKKLIKVDTEINPLGENPFGESVSLYDGSFSFSQTDISVPGNGPLIQVSRQFKADGDIVLRQGNAAFGDWDIDIPKLSTIASNAGDHVGWLVNSLVYTDRCTSMREPPEIVAGRPGSTPASPSDWWNEGYKLNVPGAGSQEVLVAAPQNTLMPQIAGMSFVATTKDHWAISCLGSTANGEPGEAFLAVAPDGSKYWLNYLVYRAARSFQIARKMGYMLATRVEDRFGNWVTYSYGASGKLSSIDASDGRKVTFDYIADGTQIAQVNVVTSEGSRSWKYSYATTATGYTLTRVERPDGKGWDYDFQGLAYQVKSPMQDSPRDCADPKLPEDLVVSGTVTGPSGLHGVFQARPTRHGRSNVREMCDRPIYSDANTARMFEHVPRYYNNLALVQKRLSGAGLATRTWTYSYPVANATWASACASSPCDYTSLADVTDPSGNTTRYTFSNQFDATEGMLRRTDYYAGGVSGTPIRSEMLDYANPLGGPWPTRYGYNLVADLNTAKLEQKAPLLRKTILQDGDSYVWQANAFNQFAQVVQTQRSNSTGQPSIQEQTSYLNDMAHWVLGLTAQVDNLSLGETVSRNEYDPATLTLSKRWRFGQAVMSYTFNAQGQLASFTDANNHTTTLQNYKRGIPQSIGYPDGHSQSLTVDEFGQIRSITDQAGQTTGYSYDNLGRISQITYPSGGEAAWYPSVYAYQFVATAERGIDAGHWTRTVSKGDSRVVTYYDAMLQPLVSDTFIATDGNSHVSTRADFDWKGQKTFVSYPTAGSPDLGAMSGGTSTEYDAIGRPTKMSQSAESGLLTTLIGYPGGAAKRVTDPKGYVTTTRYQVFDQPAYDAVISVDAPEGISQAIARDLYGNPSSIRQWSANGAYGANLTKWLYYDSYHRLCRTTEPESGSEVTAYDAAGNVDWTASGLAVDPSYTGCGLELAPAAARTTRTYDEMNRVKSLVPPAGTQATTYAYDALGNVRQADSGITTWTGERNNLGQLTSEVLSVNGNGNNAIRYAHDAYGNVATVSYPDATVVDYAPDALGRPTRAGNYAASVSYHPDGELAHFVYGNGTDYLAQKNARQLLSNFTYAHGGTLNLSEDYSYDANGNIGKITDLATGQRTKVFDYDTLNRLTRAQADGLWGVESYSYDALNNIRSRISSGQTFDYNYDGANRLASISQAGNAITTLAYDARGNVINKNGNTLAFDAKNQLTGVAGYGSYAYDAMGRRVLKTPASNAGSTYYFYTQAGQLLYQYDASTTKFTDYIYLGKKLITRIEGSTSAIIGHVDGVVTDANGNNANVSGWACSSGLAQSIQVHLYAGGPYGTGTLVGAYSANVSSEPAVASSCGVSSGSYRFLIALADATRSQYAGQKIYIHGISPVGNDNSLIGDSGTFSIPALPTAPAAPASLSADKLADLSRINVSWQASTGATSYKLQKQFNGGAWADAYTGTATSYAIDNPADGNYAFQVQACNAVGCSGWKASGTVAIAHIPPTPASLSAPASSNGPIALSWASSAYATQYDLYQSINGGGWTKVYTGAATSTSVTATVSGSYVFRVAASNANGSSGYATSATVAVTVPPASAPAISAPGSNNTGGYTVSWSAVGGAASYTLMEQVNGGGWTTVQANGATSWAASGRGNGTYGYRVQACNGGGCGPWSSVANVAVALVPGPVTGISLVDSVSGKIEKWTVNWNAVALATRYEILRVQTGVTVYSGTALTYVLESGTSPYPSLKYSYRIRACNDVGCSGWVDTGS